MLLSRRLQGFAGAKSDCGPWRVAAADDRRGIDAAALWARASAFAGRAPCLASPLPGPLPSPLTPLSDLTQHTPQPP